MRIDNTLVWQPDTGNICISHRHGATLTMATCKGWRLGIMKKYTELSLAVNYESNEYLYLRNIRVAALLPSLLCFSDYSQL